MAVEFEEWMNKNNKWGFALAIAVVIAGLAIVLLLQHKIHQVSASSTPEEGAHAKNGTVAGKASPAVSVTTIEAIKRAFPVTLASNGVVEAFNTVDIRPQVSSTIAKINFKEGQFVKAGEVLFVLDSRADETEVAKAQAQLQKDLATLEDYQRQLARNRDLFERKFISQSAVDTSLSQVEAQKGVAAADRAALKAAQVALSYNRIVAPISGRTGSVNVFPGTLVQPSSAQPLVTITQLDPIKVGFSLPQRYLPDALASMQNSANNVTVQVPEKALLSGRLQFVDNAVDAASGTVKVKAVFDNKAQLLWPGAYVNVTLTVRTLQQAIVIPLAAIIASPNDKSVYVVGAAGRAEQRKIRVLYQSGNDAVVSGIEAGEKVVVEGQQNLRPGAPVHDIAAAVRPAQGAARASPLAHIDGAAAKAVAP